MLIKTSKTRYDPKNVEVGIVHIGLGAFHRAHQAVYVEKNLNRNAGGNWGICSVNIRSNKNLVDQLSSSGYRYHTAEYIDNKEVLLREVSAIKDTLFYGEDQERLFDNLLSCHTKIVSLTITEKGYCLTSSDKKLRNDDPHVQHDIAFPKAPITAPGILVEALFRRRLLGVAPFTILSCDNMPNNGDITRQALTELASHRSDEFAQWIQHEVAFPNSMVDRIVPAMTDDSLERIKNDLDCDDRSAVMCEAFSQWIIEDNFPLGRPDWEHDGVQMVADVRPFEMMKLRLLNGSHSILAYLGLAAGFKTISEVIAVPQFANLIRHYMTVEALPTLSMPKEIDLAAYIEQLISRFSNDSLHHQLRQIATDGSQKIPQRWFASIEKGLPTNQEVNVVVMGLAAWILYVRGTDLRDTSYVVDDPMADQLREIHLSSDSPDMLIRNILSVRDIFPDVLRRNETFYLALLKAYKKLIDKGVAASLNF